MALPYLDLIKSISDRSGVQQTTVKKVMTGLIEEVEARILNLEEISIPKLGKFYNKKFPPREVRNPRTGEILKSDETYTPKFKMSTKLKRIFKDG
jgi:nucleoid DNA-binding protein